jgi:hypothetical protein
MPDDQSLVTNPFYAVTFASHIFNKHTEGPKEDWVLLNAHLIKEMSAKTWLSELLDVLSQSRAKYDGHDAINPTLAINVSDRLQGKHEPLVTREQWTDAEAWLWQFLDVLETGGPQ